jgi:hypothetical protein
METHPVLFLYHLSCLLRNMNSSHFFFVLLLEMRYMALLNNALCRGIFGQSLRIKWVKNAKRCWNHGRYLNALLPLVELVEPVRNCI